MPVNTDLAFKVYCGVLKDYQKENYPKGFMNDVATVIAKTIDSILYLSDNFGADVALSQIYNHHFYNEILDADLGPKSYLKLNAKLIRGAVVDEFLESLKVGKPVEDSKLMDEDEAEEELAEELVKDKKIIKLVMDGNNYYLDKSDCLRLLSKLKGALEKFEK